jgi:hypothetical protein
LKFVVPQLSPFHFLLSSSLYPQHPLPTSLTCSVNHHSYLTESPAGVTRHSTILVSIAAFCRHIHGVESSSAVRTTSITHSSMSDDLFQSLGIIVEKHTETETTQLSVILADHSS